MVCITYGLHAGRLCFHGKDGNHENNENDEDNSDGYKQGNKGWNAGFAEFTDTTEMMKATGIWGVNHGFPKQQV